MKKINTVNAVKVNKVHNVPTNVRYLNSTAVLVYTHKHQEYILGSRQVLPVMNLRYEKMLTPAHIMSLHMEFELCPIDVGDPTRGLSEKLRISNDSNDSIEYIDIAQYACDAECDVGRNIKEEIKFLKESTSILSYPAGYHTSAVCLGGCGLRQQHHVHEHITMQQLYEQSITEDNKYFQGDYTLEVEFWVESSNGKVQYQNPLNGKMLCLEQIKLPAFINNYPVSYANRLNILQDVILQKYGRHKEIFMSFQTIQTIIDGPILSSELTNLETRWVSTPYNKATGYYGIDAHADTLIDSLVQGNINTPRRRFGK